MRAADKAIENVKKAMKVWDGDFDQAKADAKAAAEILANDIVQRFFEQSMAATVAAYDKLSFGATHEEFMALKMYRYILKDFQGYLGNMISRADAYEAAQEIKRNTLDAEDDADE